MDFFSPLLSNSMLYYRITLFFLLGLSFGLVLLQAVFDANLLWVGNYFLAQVTTGISATVPPNPINTLAQQLKEKELQLKSKEEIIDRRELFLEQKLMAELTEKEKESRRNIMIFLGAVSCALLSLILLNFYLDWKRNKKELGIRN